MQGPNLIFMSMAFLVGIVFHSLVPVIHYIYNKVKYVLIKVNQDEMYATYSYKIIEPWLQESYNQLYQVTHVGKRYVKLSMVDRKSGYNQQEIIITKEDLSNNYRLYEGNKSNKNKLKQRLNKK